MWDSAKLYPTFFYGLIFVIGYSLNQSGWGGLITMLGAGLTILGMVLMGITIMIYVGERGAEILMHIAEAFAVTKKSVLAKNLHGLNADQTSIVKSEGEISIGVKLTARGPCIMVHGTGVPLDFVQFEFLPRCAMDSNGITHTAPIGTWSDGKTWKDYGECRTLAREFTQHLVSNGIANWVRGFGAAGDHATLVGDLNAFELRKMLGLVERSAVMSEIDQAETKVAEVVTE